MSETLISGAEYNAEAESLSPLGLMERIRAGRREVRAAQALLAEQLSALEGRQVAFTGLLDSRGRQWYSPKEPVEGLRVFVEKAQEVDPRLEAQDRLYPCIAISGYDLTTPGMDIVTFHVSQERGSIEVLPPIDDVSEL
jgi:hypothetical protein